MPETSTPEALGEVGEVSSLQRLSHEQGIILPLINGPLMPYCCSPSHSEVRDGKSTSFLQQV